MWSTKLSVYEADHRDSSMGLAEVRLEECMGQRVTFLGLVKVSVSKARRDVIMLL